MEENTHVVLDTIYTEEEGQECFTGTEKECIEFVSQQGDIGLVIVPITRKK